MKFSIGDKVTPINILDYEYGSCMVVVAIAPGCLGPEGDKDIMVHAVPENDGFVGEYLEDELRIFNK